MPRGQRRLPEACVELMQEADLILHGGDLVTLDVLEEIEQYGEVVAVHGNIDAPEVRRRLPERRIVVAEGVKIGMVHDAGPARGRLARLERAFPEADAAIFGHSHMP